MSAYTLNDIPLKTALGMAQKNPAGAGLSHNLYQLLVLVNGTRTVAELLRLGVPDVSLAAFDTLHQRKFIEGGSGGVVQSRAPAGSVSQKGLAEARFAVLDLLLDLSEQDFGARPWVDRIEQVDSLGRLSAEVEAFCLSPCGRKHATIHGALRQAARP